MFDTNVGFCGGYFGKTEYTANGPKFRKLGRKATLENIYEVIDDGEEKVYLKLSTDFMGKRKYAYILAGQFMEAKTIKSLSNVGFDVTSATFNAFVDSIRIQIEDFDAHGYAPTPAYEYLGWVHPADEDDNVLYYRASALIGYPQAAKYIGSYDIEPCGSYEIWRNMVLTDVVPYPTLQLVLIAALASVVVGILSFATPIENPVVHLNLPSGRGKSTAGSLGGSVLGRPFDGTLPVKDEDNRTVERHSIYQSWGSTDNALVATQAGNRGAVVVLNELGKSLTKNMTRVLFDISEGSDKKRLTSTLEQRSSKGYATTFLSTGESSLLEKCNTRLEGLAVRVMEITSELTTDAFHSNRIKDTCFSNCGHAAPMMAQYLLDQGGIDYVLPKYKKYVADLRATFPPSPSKDRFVEKFAALFMTTLDIASDALGIPFDKQGLLDFLLAYDQEHGADRDTSASSYGILIQLFNSQQNKFMVRYDKTYPHSMTPDELPSNPHLECWGRITHLVKDHSDSRLIIQEIEVRKLVLEKLLKDQGFDNKATCIAAWRKADVLDAEDATHPCRKRKLDPTADTGSHEAVYVFRVFATDEDAAKIHAAQQPKKQAISRLTRASTPNKQMSKIKELLNSIREEDEDDARNAHPKRGRSDPQSQL